TPGNFHRPPVGTARRAAEGTTASSASGLALGSPARIRLPASCGNPGHCGLRCKTSGAVASPPNVLPLHLPSSVEPSALNFPSQVAFVAGIVKRMVPPSTAISIGVLPAGPAPAQVPLSLPSLSALIATTTGSVVVPPVDPSSLLAGFFSVFGVSLPSHRPASAATFCCALTTTAAHGIASESETSKNLPRRTSILPIATCAA